MLAQQAEQLPLAVMRGRQLEAHAPRQENVPLYSSGWHLAFLLLGKDSFIDALGKKAHQRLAIHPLLSALLARHTMSAPVSPRSVHPKHNDWIILPRLDGRHFTLLLKNLQWLPFS